jgi:transposase-like protein
MKLHGNAALSWHGKRRLAERVVIEGWTLKAAAEAAGVSVRCARKWVSRYRLGGESGLVDRSPAPGRVANRTPKERVDVSTSHVLPQASRGFEHGKTVKHSQPRKPWLRSNL